MIPRFPSCYDSAMRNVAGLLGPSGVRSLVAESLLLKHQLVIVNRSRQRSPNLPLSDRILAGLLALLVGPARLLRSAIVLKPSTLLALHKAMSKQKYLMLFSPNSHLVLDDGISRKQAARFQDLLLRSVRGGAGTMVVSDFSLAFVCGS